MNRNECNEVENEVEWEHNKTQLQSAFSTVCGQYCIYFLYHRCRRRSMSSIVNSFENDKKKTKKTCLNMGKIFRQ